MHATNRHPIFWSPYSYRGQNLKVASKKKNKKLDMFGPKKVTSESLTHKKKKKNHNLKLVI
jgi:hypothetical protein